MHLPGLFEQPARGGLEHHPHRRGGRAHGGQLVVRHDAGVRVGEHPGLCRDQPGHVGDVGERRCVAVLVEPRARLRPAVFGPVAEREQRLLAPECRALPRDLQHLFGAHVHRLLLLQQLTGGVDEHAVVAAVAAQGRQRHEHLARVRDDARASRGFEARVARRAREGEHPFDVGALRLQQRLSIVGAQPLARLRACEGRVHGLVRARSAVLRGGIAIDDGHHSSLSPVRDAETEPRGFARVAASVAPFTGIDANRHRNRGIVVAL